MSLDGRKPQYGLNRTALRRESWQESLETAQSSSVSDTQSSYHLIPIPTFQGRGPEEEQEGLRELHIRRGIPQDALEPPKNASIDLDFQKK